ncbi:unnamed protein product, partial [marine sediment metagenome]
MDKRKVCITGVSGFIGSSLAKRLSRDWHIIGIDRAPLEKEFTGYVNEFYQQDINESLPDIVDVYAVVHLAATAGVRESESNFTKYVSDNILGTKSILNKCMSSWKPERCLITSSSSVYGGYTEPCHPKSPYALTKLCCEQMLEMYSLLGNIDKRRYTVIRPFTVYGPRQ